jgi:hypothetical protein
MAATTAMEASAGYVPVESATCYGTAAESASIAPRSVSNATAVSVTAAKAVTAAEPWAGADKEAPIEPIGTIVAVGCAGVGCGVIVAVIADGRPIGIGSGVRHSGTEADRNLCVREGGREEENTEYGEIT